MMEMFDNLQSSLISYFVASIGIMSQANIMFVLGALVMVVRLIYDTIRLIRYIKNPHKRTEIE